jgi:ATP/maltotriose-dependent transcriptional regulator MalT
VERTVLAGRERELELLDRALADVREGRTVAVQLVGEPGIGKTCLLGELADRADVGGALVLRGAASELDRDLPFWVFVDALDDYLHALTPGQLRFRQRDVLGELATVFPALTHAGHDRQVAGQHERYRTHRAVRELLELLAVTQPVVLVLDDLHWADPASVELLSALLHRPPAAPVLMGLGMRPRPVSPQLAGALARAHRPRELDRLELRPLTVAEARTVLGEDITGPLAAAFYTESGGNPFYLDQLVRAASGGRRTASPGAPSAGSVLLAGLELPPMVASALSEELALLPPKTRAVLQGAAVAGDPFEPELAAVAADVSEAATLEALDELLEVDVVRPTSAPRRFRLRHPIVHRMVYESSQPAWRIGAHERVARALAATDAGAAACAHHVERSARRGDLAAVRLLYEAGAQATPRAPATAAHWFGTALELLPATGHTEDRIALLLPQAAALAAVGRYDESHAALLATYHLLPPGPGNLRTRMIASLAGLEQMLGKHEDARARLLDALGDLPESDSAESAAFLLELAYDRYFVMEYDRMEEWARRSLAVAERLDEPAACASAAAAIAVAGAFAGTGHLAQADCTAAARLVDRLPDDQNATRPGLTYVALAELLLERFDDAARHAERAVTIARATGQGQFLQMLLPVRASSLLLRGALVEARMLLDDAVDAARLVGSPRALAWVLLNRSGAALTAGDLPRALADAYEGADLVRGLDEPIIKGWAGHTLAAVLLESGQVDEAITSLLEYGGGDHVPRLRSGWRVYAFEVLTRCHLARGSLDQAETAAARAETTAEMLGLAFARQVAHRATAAVRLDQGDTAAAAQLALASAAWMAEAGLPVEAALSSVLAGRALARCGHRERAIEILGEAVQELDRVGATRRRAAAERELRLLGQHVRRRPRPAADPQNRATTLTGRELEVAMLVAEGRTNPEIAAVLFLSVKTVETHLRSVFQKLGVSSRLHVARVMDQN